MGWLFNRCQSSNVSRAAQCTKASTMHGVREGEDDKGTSYAALPRFLQEAVSMA